MDSSASGNKGPRTSLNPAQPNGATDLESQKSSDISSSQQDEGDQRQLSRAAFVLLFSVCTVTYSGYTLLFHLCDTDAHGNYLFLTGSMVMLTELIKLAMSLAFMSCQACWLWQQSPSSDTSDAKVSRAFRVPGPVELVPYGVPAVLYAINNNLGAHLQLHMDPVSFQILSNLKIVTTALLFRSIMRREIGRVQWFALIVLFLAGVANSIGGLAESAQTASRLHVTPRGLGLLILYCSISGLAGVYTEYVLKRQAALSVHLQNSLLYVCGIGLNLLIFAGQSSLYGRELNLLRGFTTVTWALVVSQALGGICMGVLMKLASNIAKLYVVSTAMLLTTAATVLLFNFSINAYCIVAFVMTIASQYLYYNGCPVACK